MGQAPRLIEERVVASTPSSLAPEYQMRAIVRREFHQDSPAVRLLVEGPFHEETTYWDSHQVELVVALLQQALPALERTERRVEGEWRRWCQLLEEGEEGPQ